MSGLTARLSLSIPNQRCAHLAARQREPLHRHAHALCQELVEGGYYPAKANVTATMKLLHLSYTLANNDEILAALIAHAAAVDAAMKEGADDAKTTGPAKGTEHPVAEGAQELP